MTKSKFFKKIQIGGLSKGELLQKLAEAHIEFNEYAKILFDDSFFNIDQEYKTVELAKVNLSDLKIENPSRYCTIIKQAHKMKLAPCPLYLGAFLRLEFLEQVEGPYLTIASEKTKEDEDYPNGFYLRNYENKLWLRGYRTDDDYLWPVDNEFIFMSG